MEIEEIIKKLNAMSEEDRIKEINDIKLKLHEISPFKNEPVDCVIWVKNEKVVANDYNPNSVAPPEMELLKISISEDGYTQPIVTCQENNIFTVVDGFHRNRVGKEIKEIKERVMGYLPVTIIRKSQEDRGDRIASTIRHNRARGKHQISKMSDIILELKKRNWNDGKIGRFLGMEADEVLRLKQVTGLAEMFKDKDFSYAWEADKTEEIDKEEIQQINEEEVLMEK